MDPVAEPWRRSFLSETTSLYEKTSAPLHSPNSGPMIESAYWKDELLSAAAEIEGRQSFRRYSEKRACLLERSIMVAMFCVRTLIERHKISDDLATKALTVEAYPKRTPKLTTKINNHRIDELFDMERSTQRTLDLAFLCNQIIHSYIIFPVRTAQQFTHLLVCSDYERNRFLYFVTVELIVSLLREVGTNYPNASEFHFDPKKRDYVVRSYFTTA